MPRGRPREFDTDAVLDKAIEVFWRQGYDGTTVADLTETMGIGMPSLYAAFRSKRQLFERATERYTASRSGQLLDALAKPTAREVTQAFLSGVIDAATRPGRPAGCFTVQAGLPCSTEDQEVPALLTIDGVLAGARVNRQDTPVTIGDHVLAEEIARGAADVSLGEQFL